VVAGHRQANRREHVQRRDESKPTAIACADRERHVEDIIHASHAHAP
jgi:hypothetical protein